MDLKNCAHALEPWTIRFNPPLRTEKVRVLAPVPLAAHHPEDIYADLRAGRQRMAIDDVAALGHRLEERRRSARKDADTLADHGLQVRKLARLAVLDWRADLTRCDGGTELLAQLRPHWRVAQDIQEGHAYDSCGGVCSCYTGGSLSACESITADLGHLHMQDSLADKLLCLQALADQEPHHVFSLVAHCIGELALLDHLSRGAVNL
jgi:hypothetical protein